jgi:hypothetical protein
VHRRRAGDCDGGGEFELGLCTDLCGFSGAFRFEIDDFIAAVDRAIVL